MLRFYYEAVISTRGMYLRYIVFDRHLHAQLAICDSADAAQMIVDALNAAC